MTAHFKDNIMTITDNTLHSTSYFKDGDKWRHMNSMKLVSFDDHLILNRILKMGKDKRGRVGSSLTKP